MLNPVFASSVTAASAAGTDSAMNAVGSGVVGAMGFLAVVAVCGAIGTAPLPGKVEARRARRVAKDRANIEKLRRKTVKAQSRADAASSNAKVARTQLDDAQAAVDAARAKITEKGHVFGLSPAEAVARHAEVKASGAPRDLKRAIKERSRARSHFGRKGNDSAAVARADALARRVSAAA